VLNSAGDSFRNTSPAALDFRFGTTLSWIDGDTGRSFPVLRSPAMDDEAALEPLERTGTRVVMRES
jgi:hypothetical protein